MNLQLLARGNDDVTEAGKAVRRELRDSAKLARLDCLGVRCVWRTDTVSVFELWLESAFGFDWTWQGATATRPAADQAAPDEDSMTAEWNEPIWTGEVVEFDQTGQRLYVASTTPDRPPTTGVFQVRPFEFLRALNSIYNDPGYEDVRDQLPPRLAATLGRVHPKLPAVEVNPDMPAEFHGLWSRSWGVLWGPPGTGKTFQIGRQVAAALNDPTERVLVISTTNQATDSVALSIGQAAAESHDLATEINLCRVGRGASYHRFESAGMLDLLRTTEAESLRTVEDLRQQLRAATVPRQRAVLREAITRCQRATKDDSKEAFVDTDVRVVVATSFKAVTRLDTVEMRDRLVEGQAPFTTIVIDEAGLLSRAAVAALSLLASRRVLLVGDSKWWATPNNSPRSAASPVCCPSGRRSGWPAVRWPTSATAPPASLA